MKKTFLMVCAAVVALVVSCGKQPLGDATRDNNPAGNTEIIFKLDATHPDGADTKAVKSAWEENDVIFVFFSGQAAPRYLELKRTGSAWVPTAKNSLALAENETGTMRAVYLPFGSDATVSLNGTDGYEFSTTYLSYYLTATLSYTVSGGEVAGTFNMQIPDGYVQFFLDDDSATTGYAIELREPHLTPMGIASIAADGTITHTNVANGAPLPGYVYDKTNKTGTDAKGYLFSGILSDGSKGVANARNVAIDYQMTLVRGGWNGTYYSMSFTDKTLYTSATTDRAVKLPAAVLDALEYKPIDLGCDVQIGAGPNMKRIYWSSRNLGATMDGPANDSATYGDYYAWGEVSPYYTSLSPLTWAAGKEDGYKWSTYTFGHGDWHELTKYCYNSTYGNGGYTDDLTELEPTDDAARVALSTKGNWRIPTRAEWLVLHSGDFTWTWSDTYKGVLITSGIAGYNDGRFLFLPAAGTWSGTSYLTAASYGYYWSSSLDLEPDPRRAFSIYYSSEPLTINHTDTFRDDGNTIRPVTD